MPDGTEHEFTFDIRVMATRSGCELRPITTQQHCPHMLTVANWKSIGGVNCVRCGPPGLLRVGGSPWLHAGFVGMATRLGDAANVLPMA